MYALDTLVLKHIREDLLTSDKTNALLNPLRIRQEQAMAEQIERLGARDTEVLAAKKNLDALYDMIRHGLVDLAEKDFKRRFLAAKEQHLRVQKERDQVAAKLNPDARVSHQKVSEFVFRMQDALAQPSTIGKRGFLRAIIDEIQVGVEQISIVGRKSLLERAILSGDAHTSPVPTFVRKWRRDRDSNPGDGFPPTHFPGVRLRPLGHLSVSAICDAMQKDLQGPNSVKSHPFAH